MTIRHHPRLRELSDILIESVAYSLNFSAAVRRTFQRAHSRRIAVASGNHRQRLPQAIGASVGGVDGGIPGFKKGGRSIAAPSDSDGRPASPTRVAVRTDVRETVPERRRRGPLVELQSKRGVIFASNHQREDSGCRMLVDVLRLGARREGARAT